MSCPTRTVDDDTIHGYVAATLPADEADIFELHLLGCSGCRDAVRIGAGTRDALLTNKRARRRRGGVAAAALTLAAASILIVVFVRGTERGGLAAFTPPSFSGTPVRRGADADSARAMVDAGMDAYQRRDYAAAVRLLAAGAQADGSPGVNFYLSVAQLATGDALGAVQAARKAMNPPSNPFAADAAVVAAKAWLRLGRSDSALAELGRAPRDAPGSAHAAALVDRDRK